MDGLGLGSENISKVIVKKTVMIHLLNFNVCKLFIDMSKIKK